MAPGIRKAESHSWAAAYERFGERVFRLILSITRDEDVASDLTHDTFVIVAERGNQYDGRGDLGPWIFRIAANMAKDWLRKAGRRRTLLRENVALPDTGGRVPDIEAVLVVRRAVDDLPEGQRAVLLLHEVDGYTHGEIAEMLGVAEGTCKARLSRARAHLRERLANEL